MDVKGQKGGMSGRQLIVITYDNNVSQNGKTQWVDVQRNMDDGLPPETNPHLVTKFASKEDRAKNPNAKPNNYEPYSKEKQFDKIVEAAGDNFVEIPSKDGKHVAKVYAVEADLMRASNGQGMVIKTETLKPSSLKIDDKIMDRQYDKIREAKAAKAAEKSASTEKDAEPEATAEVEAQEPELDDSPAL